LRPLARAVVIGSVASVASTVTLSLASHRATGSAVSGTNATSHWLWGRPAQHRRQATLRHTVPGYLIHHACSIFWALFFERATAHKPPPARMATTAAVTAAMAYVVDYHVIPSRLNPGFEQRMTGTGLLATFASFAAGLLAGRRLLDRGAGSARSGHD